jgi:hypothetical protein
MSGSNKDIRDIPEAAFERIYTKYLSTIERPVPPVVHRQDRSIPGCIPPGDRKT